MGWDFSSGEQLVGEDDLYTREGGGTGSGLQLLSAGGEEIQLRTSPASPLGSVLPQQEVPEGFRFLAKKGSVTYTAPGRIGPVQAVTFNGHKCAPFFDNHGDKVVHASAVPDTAAAPGRPKFRLECVPLCQLALLDSSNLLIEYDKGAVCDLAPCALCL